MNEVHDVQPGHIYQPGNKKEVRLVYRILSGPYCGRHQKSFSLTKWGVAGAWDAAQQAKAYMLQTGRLPPSFASPYSRSKLTNASANAIVLSKPLQAARPLIHSGALSGGHARADAASLLAGAVSGGHLNLDPTNAAIAAAASRFLPLETFAAMARSLQPHHAHGGKDGPASGLAFSALSDNIPAPFPSFLPPPTFPARPAAAGSPAGSWSYLTSVHATLAAAAAAQRAAGAGSAGHVGGPENNDEHTATGHNLVPYSFEQEDTNSRGCVASATEIRIRSNANIADPVAEAADGGPPMMNSYQGSLPTHPSELVGLHMLPGAARPPPYAATAAADRVCSAALPSSNAISSATTDGRAAAAAGGPINSAAAAATAFTLLQLAEQNPMLPQEKGQQQLNHNALQHFMLLHQLQMMQEKQQKDAQQHLEEHERLCSLKSPSIQAYQPTAQATEGGRVKVAETADGAEEAVEATELEKQDDVACSASASSAQSDLTRATSVERWQNETCNSAAVGDEPPLSDDAVQPSVGSITCPTAPGALSQAERAVSAAHDAFVGLQPRRQHEHQYHPAEHQGTQERPRQTSHQHNAQIFSDEGNYESMIGMRETLRNLLIAASLQQQRLHQQHLAAAEHFHNHHPHVQTLAMKGFAVGRSAAAHLPPPGLLNMSALASLLPGGMLSHKQQTAGDSMRTHSSSTNYRTDDSVGTGALAQADTQEHAAGRSTLEGEKPTNTHLSGEFHSNKEVDYASNLSLLWGFPQVDHLAVKPKHPVTTAAGAGGHCDATGATAICSLETGPPLRPAATLDGESLTLLNGSATAAVAARLKRLPECPGAVLQHAAASSSEGVGSVEGECETMSSSPPVSRDACEKEGLDSFQLARTGENRIQLSLLQNLPPPPLQILPVNNGDASPLRLAHGADTSGNICCAADGSSVGDDFAVAACVAASSGARCRSLMHSELHGPHLSNAAVRGRVTATPEETAAAGSNPAALRTFGSPNNTPSRTSGGIIQTYCAAADARTYPSSLESTGDGGIRSTGDRRLHSDTTSRSACVTSLGKDLLQVHSSKVTNASALVNTIGDAALSEALLADASPGKEIQDVASSTAGGKIRDDSNRTTANAAGGHGSSDILIELAVGTNGVVRNNTAVEEDNSSNCTRDGDVLEAPDCCANSSTSGSNRIALRRRSDTAATVAADALAAPAESLSCVKRARVDLKANDETVSDVPSNDSQDEKELRGIRSRTTDGKKHASTLSDAGRIRGVGKHHTRRRLCF